jgi:hypothetical protein
LRAHKEDQEKREHDNGDAKSLGRDDDIVLKGRLSPQANGRQAEGYHDLSPAVIDHAPALFIVLMPCPKPSRRDLRLVARSIFDAKRGAGRARTWAKRPWHWRRFTS